jgi:hypothetical protein
MELAFLVQFQIVYIVIKTIIVNNAHQAILYLKLVIHNVFYAVILAQHAMEMVHVLHAKPHTPCILFISTTTTLAFNVQYQIAWYVLILVLILAVNVFSITLL